MSIEISPGGLERAERVLAHIPGGIETALSRAINRALQQGRTAATREVRRVYTVRAKDVRSSLSIAKATKTDPTGVLKSNGKRLRLSAFQHSPSTDTTGSKHRPVRVGIKRGSSKAGKTIFVHHGEIFQRLGKEHLPVQLQFGPAAPVMLDNEIAKEAVQSVMADSVERRLDHEVQRLLAD